METPRPLAAPLRRWAQALSGRSAPRYTAGPATSAALAATGARAASSGDVVHLPGPPAATGPAGGVLAHELTHLRQPLGRPRFLMEAGGHTPDADEQVTVRRLARPSAPTIARVGDTSAGIVENLRVAPGITGSVMEAARVAVREELAPLTGGTDPTSLARPDGLPTPAGWSVDQLIPPTGFGAEIPNLATRFASQLSAGGQSVEAGGLSEAVGGINGAGGVSGTGGMAGMPGITGLAGIGAAASDGTPPVAPEHLVDRMVDALEQRVIAELERRGGRYSGAF